jgi:hypothetical protein
MTLSDHPGIVPITDERRRPYRHKTYLGGLAVSREAGRTVNCTVRNLSSGGAKLTVRGEEVVNEHTWLLISGHESVYECLVVWVLKNDFGLMFKATFPFESLNAAGLHFLRSLAMERLPRPGFV